MIKVEGIKEGRREREGVDKGEIEGEWGNMKMRKHNLKLGVSA